MFLSIKHGWKISCLLQRTITRIINLCQVFQNPWLGSWSPVKPLHLWLPSTIARSLHAHSQQQAKSATLGVLNAEEQPLTSVLPQQKGNHKRREFLGGTQLQSYQQVLLCQLSSFSCTSLHRPTNTRGKWQESATAHMEFNSRDNKWLGSLSRPGWKENKLFSYELENGYSAIFYRFYFQCLQA